MRFYYIEKARRDINKSAYQLGCGIDSDINVFVFPLVGNLSVLM